MKSTLPSPFDWKIKPATLFTKKEKSNMNSFTVAKTLKPKQMNTYSRAGIK
jgi:hypothetical protein